MDNDGSAAVAEKDKSGSSPDAPEIGGTYAKYVLGVLFVVYLFNFLDRQIISILAERIKADLGVTDSQLGFLYGTAFAVFYAVFGVPLGRLADVWLRGRLIAIGLSFWSLMTAISGLTTNFTQLAAARIGVGIGEASATPAAFSLLSDYFPKRVRATVLAIYSSGVYVGAGLSLGLGGVIVERWDNAYPAATAPFGLAGWQVAFMAVGLPGLLVALWVASLREPVRGQADGIITRAEPHPFRTFWRELIAVVPPFTVYNIMRLSSSWRPLLINGIAALVLALIATVLIFLFGDVAQWVALSIGLYSTVSWIQSVHHKDRPTFALIFRTPTLLFAGAGFGTIAFMTYGVGFWSAPYAVRVLGADEAEVGAILGGTAAVGGFLGVSFGGVLSDMWRRVSENGRIKFGILAALLPIPVGIAMFTTDSRLLFYVLSFPITVLSSCWVGAAASTIQDLVMPRMRGAASAIYILVVTFLGLSLGPYTVGRISEGLSDLRTAILWSFVASAVAAVLLFIASTRLARDEGSILERARAVGEPV